MWMKWNYPNQVLEYIIYRYNRRPQMQDHNETEKSYRVNVIKIIVHVSGGRWIIYEWCKTSKQLLGKICVVSLPVLKKIWID